MGNARKMAITANVISGLDAANKAKPTLGDLSFEVQYNKVWQDLPGNCNGGAVCVAATPLIVNGTAINKDPSNWVGRLTASRNW